MMHMFYVIFVCYFRQTSAFSFNSKFSSSTSPVEVYDIDTALYGTSGWLISIMGLSEARVWLERLQILKHTTHKVACSW